MTIGIAIKGPEGLVLAAESRVTLTGGSGRNKFPVFFDNATKVLPFSRPHNYIGAVTYGLGTLGLRTAASFLPEFEQGLSGDRISVLDFANLLKTFFIDQWNVLPKKIRDRTRGPMVFIVAGFNDGEPHGRIYEIHIPKMSDTTLENPNEHHASPDKFGITWGGQRLHIDRLIRGYDAKILEKIKTTLGLEDEQIAQLEKPLSEFQLKIPMQFLALQDCIDLSLFFIKTTMEAQRLTLSLRGCGGPIDVATITRSHGFKFVQEKALRGDFGD